MMCYPFLLKFIDINIYQYF